MTQTDLFRLKWNNHNSNISSVISTLYSEEKFCDVTLGAEGHYVQAHRLVLIACSEYFQTLLSPITAHQHPIFILEGIKLDDLKAILDYMYLGQVSVRQDQLQSVLKSSETLRVKSLGDISVQLRGMTKNSVKKAPEISECVKDLTNPNIRKAVNIISGPESKSKRLKTCQLESNFENTRIVVESSAEQAMNSENNTNIMIATTDGDSSIASIGAELDHNFGHNEEHFEPKTVKLDLSRSTGPMLSSLPLSPGKVSGPATGPAFRKKQSRVWSYFEKINSGQDVECTVCGETQRYIGNTTNMTRHIEKRHLTVQDDRTVVAAQCSRSIDQEEQERKRFKDKRKSTSRSVVWQYFSRDCQASPKKVKCKLCQESYAFCNNTTNLHLHLKTKHPEVSENMRNMRMMMPVEYEQEEEAVEYEQQEEAVEYYLEASDDATHVAGGQLVNVQTGQLVETSRFVSVEVCDDGGRQEEPVYVVAGDIETHAYNT